MINSDEITKIREELRGKRDERREQDNGQSSKTSGIIDKTGGNIGSVGSSSDREERSGTRNPERVTGSSTKSDRTKSGISNGIDKKPGRERSSTRRSSEDHSSTLETSAILGNTGRRVGRFIRDDEIPTRKNKPVASKPAKEDKTKAAEHLQAGEAIRQAREGISKAKKLIPSGQRLSAVEANSIHDEYCYTLASNFQFLDELLWYYTSDTSHEPIWSSISDEEIQMLARPIIKTGQKSALVAGIVRAQLESSTYIDVGRIALPRFVRTVQKIKQAPKRPKLGLLQRKRMVRGEQ